MNWDNARVFLAIYRHGTLRGAAMQLGIDQATAGRRLAALEESLEARLFLRTPTGYVPTQAGELALLSAENMESAAHQLQRQMQGQDGRLSGGVRLASTDTIAVTFLMRALQQLHERHPDIQVTLTTATQLSNLTRREADMAVRSVRPDDPELITRHLTSRQLGLYATREYLAARGEPKQGSAFTGHDLVIYQEHIAPYQRKGLCNEPISNGRIMLEVNSGLMMAQAVSAGLGIGELPTHLAARFPELIRVWPERSDSYDIWLVMHNDLNRTARVRAVVDVIVEVFEET